MLNTITSFLNHNVYGFFSNLTEIRPKIRKFIYQIKNSTSETDLKIALIDFLIQEDQKLIGLQKQLLGYTLSCEINDQYKKKLNELKEKWGQTIPALALLQNRG